MEKLVVVVMGQNCEKFIGMSLESVKDADAIVYCDGGSTDKTISIVKNFAFDYVDSFAKEPVIITENEYDQEDLGMNGRQRNFYLEYVKKKYPDWWCLAIDADEVVEDLSQIKEFIQTAPKRFLYSPKMRHFIGDLGHEDFSQVEHFVPHRLFHINKNLFYEETEHTVLMLKGDFQVLNIRNTTIWHLAYLSGMWDIKNKYENHIKKSNIHPEEFLNNWKKAHLFGQYPKKPIKLLEIPEIILKEFGVEKDELYFMGRMQLEAKHFIQIREWMKKFKPKTVLDIGCGWGLYGQAAKILSNNIKYVGFEKSKWVVRKWPHKDLEIIQGDIEEGIAIPDNNYDLVLCIDVLEHIDYEKLDFVLHTLSKLGKHFIFSICYKEDPNWPLDPTHKIKESKEWWIKKLNKYFNINEPPEGWLFNNQILVGDVDGK